MSVQHLVLSGPLILAIPVAAAAGAVTFLSPCCLPLVPGYLSYITGMAGAGVKVSPQPAPAAAAAGDAAGAGAGGSRVAVGTRAQAPAGALPAPARGRAVAGAALFVLGFSAVFTTYGLALGSLGHLLRGHMHGLTQVLGGLTIVLGLLFAGAFDRFSFAGRILRPSARPRAGLAGAPLLGMMFGLGWTPCAGPTLSTVLALATFSGTAPRGAVLAFVYGLGLGIPFLLVALAFQRTMNVLSFARRNARLISRIGGAMLVVVGVLEVSGAWSAAIIWLQDHWVGSYRDSL
ncbi:MAG: sulfite exporter TauE/SafE family protein [Streptosporangiaceae bacterium]|nr:sulfite exporter TauE/SafE family protein [Streptosporangiaceae bacterium]